MKHLFLFSLLFVFSLQSFAQQKTAAAKTRTRPSVFTKSYFQFGLIGHLSQENIKTERSGVSEDIESQSQGLTLSLRYIKPTSSVRWIQSHAAEFTNGYLRLQGVTATLNDELKNQPWVSVTLSPGMSYRTTSVSEIGLSLPLTYRAISWQLKDPTYKLGKTGSFSYGLAGTFTNNFSLKNSLLVSVTHQFVWNSTVWSAGWLHSFR